MMLNIQEVDFAKVLPPIQIAGLWDSWSWGSAEPALPRLLAREEVALLVSVS